ncbi:M60 family metallopeptidase [Bacteroides finegoldii]|uniref:M60 family metallopeptidase n=1 Tax=Bacteroides finegoldii TaxID=338188 RepID=UPI0018A09234|nr:M60 family metallopeptidase [Bacteroides finegoldii]
MKKIVFTLLYSLFLFTACSDDDERNDAAPYLRIPEIAQSLHYLKDVQRENIKIETNCGDWTITSDKTWCEVHRISSNPQMFRLALEENADLKLREAKLTLKASGITETINVKQLGTEPAILVSPEKFDNLSDTKGSYELTITTNVSSFQWNIPEEDKTWLSVAEAPAEDVTRAMVDSKYLLTVQTNLGMTKRSSTITFIGTGDEEKHPAVTLPITQKKRTTDASDVEVGEDTKFKPTNAWASSEQTNPQPIFNAYDSKIDDDHCYHTNWYASADLIFPLSLEFYFDGTQDMDYTIFYPNGNGKFKEIELYYLDDGDPITFDQAARPETSPSEGRTWTPIKSYTLQDISSEQKIVFPERLTNVLGIKYIIKSTYSGDKAACNEIEFCRSNASFLDAQLLNVFKDITCCELKENVTEEMINELPGYFAQLAFQIKEGTYTDKEKKFRIQEYKPYSKVEDTANAMLIKKYGNQDNITGIHVKAGENIIVLVGDTYKNDIYLQVLGEETIKNDDGTTFVQTESPTSAQTIQLFEGVNKVQINKTGMLFILYAADPTNENNKPIKIHIPYESGKVSGFFDLETDKTDAKYAELLSQADYKYFGVRGKNIIFYFHTSQLRKVVPNNIVAAIELWDNIVGWEQEIIGFTGDLRKRYNNHVFAISPEGGYMWQSEYRVAFVYSYLENILLPENVKEQEDNAWGPAHEIGHIHQKAINWPGCSESSNNLFSNYIIYKMGKYRSRGYGLCRVAQSRFVEDKPWVTFGQATHQNEDTEIHMRMYWQLFVYYHLCKNKNDFWPTVFANMRQMYGGAYTEQDPGKSQMMFVKAVCAAANEDLTDFFDFWGFFKPVDNLAINQYGDFTYNVTEGMIKSTKEEIQKYQKAAPIQYIEDRKKDWFTPSPNEYRDKESGDVGFYDQFKGTAQTFNDDEITATISGKKVSVNSNTGKKAVSFEVRNGAGKDGTLVYFSNDFEFTLPDNIQTNEVKLWAVQADGERKSIKVN